jgi:acetylornithine deacetylase
MITKHRSLEILEDLIRIQSVNPHYGTEARGENELSEYVEQFCRQAGLQVTRQKVFPGRDNLLIELRVGRAEHTLLFEAHMDTVSLGSMENPLEPTYKGDRLYGRGACDTKGSLAGMLYAMEQCAKYPEQLSADVVLCASVDEEHAYRGLMAFLELDIPISGAIVGEPTELGIVIAQKGCARFEVRTQGKAAHTSMPHEGNNAIYQMMDVIRFIREEIEPELAGMEHPLCGKPTIAVGTICGGEQINIVPEQCAIKVDRRTIPGEDSGKVLSDFNTRLQAYAENNGVVCKVEELLLDWALDTSPDEAVVQAAMEASRQLELPAILKGVPYGSDASKLQHYKNIPSIVYGPGSISQAHSREEWVPIREVEQAAEFYLRMAMIFAKEGGANATNG